MAERAEAEPAERFRPTSGRFTGVLLEVFAALGLLLAYTDRDQGYAPALALGACFVAVLAWAAMLRPGLALTPTHLVLRNMVETIHVPLAAIETLVVRQVLAVRAGERRYVSSAVGHSWRKAMKASRQGDRRLTPEQALAQSYPDYVEARIRQRCEDARSQQGVQRGSPEQLALAEEVRREPAWLEIGLLSGSGAAFLLVLLL